MTERSRSKKAAGAVAFLATLGVSTSGPLVAGAQAPSLPSAGAGAAAVALPAISAEDSAAADAFEASYPNSNVAFAHATAFADLWELSLPVDAKVQGGYLLLAGEPLPPLSDLNFFHGHGYDYVDALALSHEWNGAGGVVRGDAASAKAKAKTFLSDAFPMPTLDSTDYYLGALYGFNDAVALAEVWESTVTEAKTLIGEKLQAGIELPNPMNGPVIFSAPGIDVVPSATAARFGAAAGVTFDCTDDVEMATCVATLDGKPYTSGAQLPTGSILTSTIVVTATDASGKVTVKEVTIAKDWAIQGTYAEASGTEGMIVRFYIATFGRLPDSGGFTFWNTMLTNDPSTLPTVTEFFTTSPEFNSLYGEGTTDEQFLDAIYTNVLGREPEAAGRAFWAGALEDGSHTRASTMEFFAQSPELKALTKTS